MTETALWPVIERKYGRYSEIEFVNGNFFIVQSAVFGPVQLTIDNLHRLLQMEVQADRETST